MDVTAFAMATTVRCDDPRGLIAWLDDAFGFEARVVVEDDDGGVRHAQLMRGDVMVMVSPDQDDALGAVQSTPQKLGGVTQSPYIFSDDVDALAERARAAGAEMVMEPRDEPYGGRHFTCRDPQGHLWNFGSYNPLAD
ncbi:MAG: VOC family protein [Pseudomonadota bacterium]